MKNKTRILIADDHGVVRSGLRALLESVPDYSVAGEACDGEEAVALAVHEAPDVVIMDISMPRMNGIEATAAIKEKMPDVKVIILTVHEDEEYVYRMLKAGANGYVLKSAGKKEIVAAIESARKGERFFSPSVSGLIVDGFLNREKAPVPRTEVPTSEDLSILTRRETEVLRYIAQGYTNRKIADELFLSVRTVNTHRTNLMQKLDIHDTARLVRYAIESGLIPMHSSPRPSTVAANMSALPGRRKGKDNRGI